MIQSPDDLLEGKGVLHLVTRFLEWGGSEKNTVRSMEALNQAGMDVVLGVGAESDPKTLRKIKDRGIEVIQFERLTNTKRPFPNFRFLFELYSFLREKTFDVLHTHQTKASVLGRIAANLAGVPHVIYGVHGGTFSGELGPVVGTVIYLLEKRLARSTDRFVTVGEDLRDRFLSNQIGHEDEYRVIRSGMDLEPFREAANGGENGPVGLLKELGLNPDDIVLGKVASLETRKGHEYAIEAVDDLTRHFDALKVLFVGEGERREELERMVRDKNLTDNIIFTGYRNDVAEIMQLLDLFIFTSMREGLPQVLVQAAASGLPIVTFDVEGACEVVDPGENGYIVESKNTDEFYEKVEKLILDDKLRKKMSRESSSKIEDQWDVETMKQDTVDLYEELLG